MQHLQAADLAVMTVYAAGLLAVGWWSSRRQVSMDEYFVGGRSISPGVAGISIIASLVSSISYLAAPGEMIRHGPGWMWQMLHAPISFAVVGYLVIPRLMRRRVISAYELLEDQFGRGVRLATSAMFVLSRFFWMGLVIYSCSLAVATVTGLPLQGILVAVGVIGTAYTILGGIRAVMLTDVLQFFILICGALLTIGFVSVSCGGLTNWWPDFDSPELKALDWPSPQWFTLDPGVRLSVLSVTMYAAAYWIMTATGDQVVIQRFLSTRDARAARRSFGLSIAGDALTSAVLFVTGMALVGYYLHFPDLLPQTAAGLSAQADRLFPHFIAAELPAGISGLVISALFAAAMSSLDSGISSITAVMVTDFESTFAGGCADDTARLRRARWIGLWIGATAIGMSFAVSLVPGSNLLETTVRVSSLLAAPLFVAFALAFFAPRPTPAGAWTSIITGTVLGVGLTFWQPIVWLLTGQASDVSVTLIMPLSAAGAFAAGVVVSLVTAPREFPE